MKSRFAPLILSVGLVAASGVGGAWLGSTLFQPSEYTHQDFHNRLYSELRLTPDQRAFMGALEERHAAEDRALNQALASANRALAEILGRETAYTNEVDSALGNVHAAMLELQKAAVRHLYEMRDILDANQRKTFDRHVAETMQRYADQRVD